MPTYEYVCKICGSHFEKNLAFEESSTPVSCPNGHLQTRKVYSVPEIVYKGKGFYVTDHRSKQGNPA